MDQHFNTSFGVISGAHIVHQGKYRKYNAYFYSNLRRKDINDHDIFFKAPPELDQINDLNPVKRISIPEELQEEWELIKPKIQNYAEEYIKKFPEYKYYRIELIEFTRPILIHNKAVKIVDLVHQGAEISVYEIEKLLSDL